MLRWIALPVIAGALCMGLAACDDVKPRPHVLRVGHTLDPQHPVHLAMERIAARVNALSGGKLQLKIYPNGQLGSEREMIELLQLGALAITKVSASPLENFSPAMQVFSLPYVFRDNAHFWQVLQSDVGRDLLLSLEDVRLRGLGYFDAGARSFYTTKTRVSAPADLAGLKIRVMNAQTAIRTVDALGGAPATISWGELYTALQQGVVDGAENNPPTLYFSRQYEVARYYTLDEHAAIPDVLLISTVAWKGLSAQERAWLEQAVADGVAYERALWAKATKEALTAIEASGVEIIRPDKAPFRAAAAELLASYAGTPTGDLIARIQTIGQAAQP